MINASACSIDQIDRSAAVISPLANPLLISAKQVSAAPVDAS